MALLGRIGAWPFAGHFQGTSGQVCWAGRVGLSGDLEQAWRASRAVQRALLRAGPIEADRRRALSVLWSRLSGVSRDLLGPGEGADLVLVAVATDEEGSAITAIGLQAVLAASATTAASPWVQGTHPLLGEPGLPARRPGALTVDRCPPWLIGVPRGVERDPRGARLERLLPACGVHR